MSFNLQERECLVVLGTNGAGKSTLFKCMTGELIPTLGSIQINGRNVSDDIEGVRRTIGYCPQHMSVLELLSAREHMDLYSQIKGVSQDKIHYQTE